AHRAAVIRWPLPGEWALGSPPVATSTWTATGRRAWQSKMTFRRYGAGSRLNSTAARSVPIAARRLAVVLRLPRSMASRVRSFGHIRNLIPRDSLPRWSPTLSDSSSNGSPRFGRRSRSMNGSPADKALANGAKAGLFLGLAAAWLIAAVLVA